MQWRAVSHESVTCGQNGLIHIQPTYSQIHTYVHTYIRAYHDRNCTQPACLPDTIQPVADK